MSKEKLDDLEKRIAFEKTKEARAYARMERLAEDIARVEATMAELGISSIEEAKKKLTIVQERMNNLIEQAYETLEEAEKK